VPPPVYEDFSKLPWSVEILPRYVTGVTPPPAEAPSSIAEYPQYKGGKRGYGLGWDLESVYVTLKVLAGVPDQFVVARGNMSFQIPADAFVHDDPLAVVVLSLEMADGGPMPDWIYLENNTTVRVRVPDGASEDMVLKITARDLEGREASTLFQLHFGGGIPAEAGRVAHQSGRPAMNHALARAAQGRAIWSAP